MITIDPAKKSISVDVSEGELAMRKEYRKPKQQKLTGYLKKYAQLVKSASEGVITW